jgi:hypothetical protein
MNTKIQQILASVSNRKAKIGLRSSMIMLVILAMLVTTVSVFAIPTPGGSHPVEVGPVSAETGFPTWYKDANGTRLELCLDGGLNPLCGYTPDSFDATQPVTVPGNFPSDGEAFYMLGNAIMDTDANGGSAILVLALEAAFTTAIVPGDQMTFGRVRIWVDNLIDGADYKVTHPYGYDLFTADTGPGGTGRRSIRWVEDIGIGAPGDFTGALNSRIGPWLKWDPAVAPAAPAGYIGDIGVLHPVVGSPFNTNFFRIEGPAGSFVGSPNQCANAALGNDPVALDDCIQINDFSLMGKYATNAGVNVDHATYTQSAADGGKLDVFASSEGGQSIQLVKGIGYGTTLLDSNGLGSYFGRIDFAGAAPAQIQVSNASDVPAATKTVPVTDKVTIKQALFDAELHTLTIEAVSSDTFNEPVLTAAGFGALEVNGMLVVNGVNVAPSVITITSAKGGSDSAGVDVIGNVSFAPMALTAGITVNGDVVPGADPITFNVQQSHTIILDGTSCAGDIDSYQWTQVAGIPVTLTGADTATASFTSASVALDSVEFQLTVTRNAPLASDSKNVVINTLDIQAPTANAGADQLSALAGSKVTLDGSASQLVSTYSWAQIVNVGDPIVTLAGVNTAKPTFTFPVYSGALTFELTVNNAGGSATDTVQVRAVQDTFSALRVEFTRSKNTWRIVGNTSILGIPAGPGNEVRAYLGVYATEAQAIAANKLIGISAVDATGAWAIRPANVPANIRAVAGNSVTLFSMRGARATSAVTIK